MIEFTQALSMNAPEFPVDLVPIALNQDVLQIENLLEHVVFCVLNSPSKDQVITRILRLSQNSQVSLMHFIKQVTREDDSIDFTMTPTRELKQLRLTQATLSSHLANVQTEFEVVWKEKERIEQEYSDLKLTNTDLENKLGHRIQRRNFTPDSIILDLEIRMSEKDQRILQLSEELAELKKSSENAINQYRDELDIAAARADSLAKVEQSAILMRKTVEEMKPLKEQLKLAQEENAQLQRRVEKQSEEESAYQSTLKQLAQVKEALTADKEKRLKLEDEIRAKDAQIKSLLKDNTELVEKLQMLESKNRELALRLDQLQTESVAEDSFAIGTPLREIGEPSIYRLENHSSVLDEEPKFGRSGDFWASDKSMKAVRELAQLASENRDLKAEKESLTEELATVKQSMELEKVAKNAEMGSVRETLERELQSLKYALVESETTFRTSNRDFSEQITALTASVKAAEMINRSLMDELAALKGERDSQSEELSQLYREKDEMCARFVSSRDETLRLNSELAEKMMKLCSLETELAMLKGQNLDPRLKNPVEESTRELELMENGRKISELKLRISELEGELREKEIIAQQKEAQFKTLKDTLEKSKQKHVSQRSKISRLSRTKEELATVLSTERDIFFSVTSEMVKTMGDLQGLVESKSLLGT